MGEINDITGMRFGRLIAVSQTSLRMQRRVVWNCTCDCGKQIRVSGTCLRNGNTKSCGCLQPEIAASHFRKLAKESVVDITGKAMGRLTAIREITVSQWEFKCICGNSCAAAKRTFVAGDVTSCGCLKRELWAEVVAKSKKPPGEALFNKLIKRYIRSAHKAGREWSLSDNDAKSLFSSRCFYCNVLPLQTIKVDENMHKYNGEILYNGIDRVDNEVGYVTGNVVAACGVCNWLKGSMSTKDFLSKIAEIFRTRCRSIEEPGDVPPKIKAA